MPEKKSLVSQGFAGFHFFSNFMDFARKDVIFIILITLGVSSVPDLSRPQEFATRSVSSDGLASLVLMLYPEHPQRIASS